MRRFLPPALLLLGVLLLGSGCSVRKAAVRQIGDALAGAGTAFSSESDPQLAREALPFALKLVESVLEEDPGHRELRTAAAAYFAQYAYAFVELDADYLEEEDWERAQEMRRRARALYLRGRDHGLRALESRSPGLARLLARDPGTALAPFDRSWVDALYWTAAAWALAINLGKEDPYLVGQMPQVQALIDRAYALDPGWGEGAIHAFLLTWNAGRPMAAGDPEEQARRHFRAAIRLGGGGQLAPYLSLAEAVSVPNQDREEFEFLIGQAMAIDIEAHPRLRLSNLLMRRRALWLLSRADQLFLPPLEGLPDEAP